MDREKKKISGNPELFSSEYMDILSSFLHRTAIQDLTAISLDVFNLQMDFGENEELSKGLERILQLSRNGMNALRRLELFLRKPPEFTRPEIFLLFLEKIGVVVINSEEFKRRFQALEKVSGRLKFISRELRWFGVWCFQLGLDNAQLYIEIVENAGTLCLKIEKVLNEKVEEKGLTREFTEFLSSRVKDKKLLIDISSED